MESATLCVLKKLAKLREMTVRDCAKLLPKKSNDHLDFYPLATLIKHGLADIYGVKTNENPFHDSSEMDIAIDLYVWSVWKGEEISYRGLQFQGADFGDEKIFATAKGYFALDEMRSKRAERIWAFSAGIVTAIVATSLKELFG